MCRHAAYTGPGIAATEILRDLDHSLHHQSYRPRELLTGVVCADGFGFGWYDPDRQEAGRYATGAPIWADPNLDTMAPSIRSSMLLAAVRNGTLASANSPADAAPFCSGRHLWSLNGSLEAFGDHWREGPLRDWTSARRRQAIAGHTDGEHLFAAWLSRLDEDPSPAGGVQALQGLLRDVLHEARQTGLEASLNILAADGRYIYATRTGTSPTQASLYVLHDGQEFPGAWVVASEPLYDDPLWEVVAPDTVLALSSGAPPVRLSA